jgi:hypothetical protein
MDEVPWCEVELHTFVGSCDDLTVMMTVPEYETLTEVQGIFVLSDDGVNEEVNQKMLTVNLNG